MRPMTWWEIAGEWLGWYAWCQECYGMRWFHRHRETPRPMLCFQHGGSEAGEATNRKHDFTCPKCSNATLELSARSDDTLRGVVRHE